MMLPFQSLLKPPFLKGCDELPNQPHDLRPFGPATAIAHPYLHVNSTGGLDGGTTLAGFGQRKNRQVTRDDLEVVLSHALKYLPKKTRGQIGLLYLLARGC